MLMRNANRLFNSLQNRPEVPWWQDVLRGAVFGDFADKLGVPGAAAQVALTLVPGVGDICILRDIVADMETRDTVDIALNVVALTPFLGGIAKTAEVVRNARRAGQTLHMFPQPGAAFDGDGIGRAG
jgi:hypothetical protein